MAAAFGLGLSLGWLIGGARSKGGNLPTGLLVQLYSALPTDRAQQLLLDTAGVFGGLPDRQQQLVRDTAVYLYNNLHKDKTGIELTRGAER